MAFSADVSEALEPSTQIGLSGVGEDLKQSLPRPHRGLRLTRGKYVYTARAHRSLRGQLQFTASVPSCGGDMQ